jgi:hypothetical protein
VPPSDHTSNSSPTNPALTAKLATLSPEERVEMLEMVVDLGEQAVLERWELLRSQIRYVLTLTGGTLMYITVLSMTDTETHHLVGTITLRDGHLIAEGEPDELPGLTYMLSKPWWVMVDGTERALDPRQEPKRFLRYAHRIFRSPYYRATRAIEA